MATKEQERKALEQIKAIVAKLGEDSYIGTAFDGCFEIAQENIDNDWACSYKQTAESKDKELATLRQRYNVLATEKADVVQSLEAKKEELDAVAAHLKTANAARREMEQKYDDLQYRYTEYYQGAEAKQKELQAQLDEAQLEIIKLKARLYDYMMA